MAGQDVAVAKDSCVGVRHHVVVEMRGPFVPEEGIWHP